GGDHVLHHGRAAETNADEEAREVGHGGGGRGTNLSLFPLTPLNLSQPLVSPSITAPAVVITSFTMAGRLRRTLMRRRGGWGMVVVDEAHVLRTARKPFDCLETRVVVDVIRRTKRAVLLTGTPSLSRPFDLFNLVDSLWPGLLGMSKYEYARNYCDRGRDSRDFSRGIRLRELHILLSHTVMVRRHVPRLKGGLLEGYSTARAAHPAVPHRHGEEGFSQVQRGAVTHGHKPLRLTPFSDPKDLTSRMPYHAPLPHTARCRSSRLSCAITLSRPPSPLVLTHSPVPPPHKLRPAARSLPPPLPSFTAALSADEGGRDHRGDFYRRGRTRPPRRIPLTRADATTAAISADEGGRDHRGGFRRRGWTRPLRRIPPTRANATTAAIPPTRADATTAADSTDKGGRDHRGGFRRRGRMRSPRRFPPTRADATTTVISADEGGCDHLSEFRRRGRTRPPRRIPPTRADATTAADSADEGGRDHHGRSP
ncbi:unnamed protein product, partial [Closterium sp. NIES-54]